MNIDDWIEIAEREVDKRISSARIAAINEDGRAESEETSWEIKWRIMCGFLHELKARRASEGFLLHIGKKYRDICSVIIEQENAQQSPYISSYEKERGKIAAYDQIRDIFEEADDEQPDKPERYSVRPDQKTRE